MFRAPHHDDASQSVAFYHQSVGGAAWNDQGAFVALLPEQEGKEAHLRYRDMMSGSVLHKTVRRSDSGTLKLLIAALPEVVDEKDQLGDTPITLVAFNDMDQTIKLAKVLLEVGRTVRRGTAIQGVSGPGEV